MRQINVMHPWYWTLSSLRLQINAESMAHVWLIQNMYCYYSYSMFCMVSNLHLIFSYLWSSLLVKGILAWRRTHPLRYFFYFCFFFWKTIYGLIFKTSYNILKFSHRVFSAVFCPSLFTHTCMLYILVHALEHGCNLNAQLQLHSSAPLVPHHKDRS